MPSILNPFRTGWGIFGILSAKDAKEARFDRLKRLAFGPNDLVKTEKKGKKMKRRTFLSTAACAALAIFAAAPATAQTRTELIREKLLSNDRNYVFVAMHRGDWRNFPENSKDAILSCIALGADIVELDTQMTKDGHFVMLHDGSLNRTTTGKGKVKDLTLAEIKQFKLKSNQGGKDAKATDYDILTLEEALALTKGKILVNIDKFTAHPYEILKVVEKVGAMKEVLVKSTHGPAEAKSLFREYWKNVESGELLYMPVVQFCWKKHAYAAKILPEWLAEEPRRASMYEVCMDSDEGAAQLEKVRTAPGAPRIWINTMWDTLNNGRGDVKGFTNPDSTWGWSLSQGATMLQTDYGAEMLVYLNRIGRHSLK